MNKASARLLSRVHRLLGLGVALFIPLLAISGLLLNHTAELQLKQRQIDWPWLTAMYGQHPATCSVAFAAGENWISLWDGQIYLRQHPIPGLKATQLVGAVEQHNILLIAADQLLLLQTDGTVIDRIDYPQGQIPTRLGTESSSQGTQIVIETAAGKRALNADMTAFKETSRAIPTQWSEAWQPGTGVSLERLLLDLHSGRFLGKIGVWLMDAAALGMIALALSGYLLHRRRKKSAAGIS